jgi:hypothetical protein
LKRTQEPTISWVKNDVDHTKGDKEDDSGLRIVGKRRLNRWPGQKPKKKILPAQWEKDTSGDESFHFYLYDIANRESKLLTAFNFKYPDAE